MTARGARKERGKIDVLTKRGKARHLPSLFSRTFARYRSSH